MITITVEGIDGAGKSTLLHGFHEEGSSHDTYVPGLVQRLEDSGFVPRVQPTREPGSVTYTDGAQPPWQKTPLMSVDRSMNTVDFWIGMARYQSIAVSEEPEPGSDVYAAQTALAAARFAHEHKTFPSSLEGALLNPETNKWPEAFRPELHRMQEEHEMNYEFVSEDPTLRRRFETYDARDCIRHALVGARDSEDLPPVANGLLFFAGHIFHGKWIERRGLGPRDVLISDRGAESQMAYGRARGDNGVVQKLYDQHRGYTSDIVLYVHTPVETALERKNGENEGGWEKEKELRRAQSAYENMWKEKDRAEYPHWESVSGTVPKREMIDAAFEQIKSLYLYEANTYEDDPPTGRAF